MLPDSGERYVSLAVLRSPAQPARRHDPRGRGSRRSAVGTAPARGRSTGSWSSPTRSPPTRWATRRGGRCSSTGRPAWSSTTRRRCPRASTSSRATPGSWTCGSQRQPFEPNMIERIDALFASGECPDAIIVFVDAWTSFGGSQFLNSTGTGRYLDYLCDELPAFRGRAVPDARLARSPRPDGQVERRLRRDGRADAAPGRVRRARHPRRGRAVRGLLSARVPGSRAATARRVRRLLGHVLRAGRRTPIGRSGSGSCCSSCTGTRRPTRPIRPTRGGR